MVTVKNAGKSGFLKEFFMDHPDAGKDAIDKAWQECGNGDTISPSLISKVRTGLGLTGKAAKAKATASPHGEAVVIRPEVGHPQERLQRERPHGGEGQRRTRQGRSGAARRTTGRGRRADPRDDPAGGPDRRDAPRDQAGGRAPRV